MTSHRAHHPTWAHAALLGGMCLGTVDIAIANVAAPSIAVVCAHRAVCRSRRLSSARQRFAASAAAAIMAVAFAGIAASLLVGNTGGAALMTFLGLGGFGLGANLSGTLNHLTGSVPSCCAPDISGVFGTAYLAVAPLPGRATAVPGFRWSPSPLPARHSGRPSWPTWPCGSNTPQWTSRSTARRSLALSGKVRPCSRATSHPRADVRGS